MPCTLQLFGAYRRPGHNVTLALFVECTRILAYRLQMQPASHAHSVKNNRTAKANTKNESTITTRTDEAAQKQLATVSEVREAATATRGGAKVILASRARPVTFTSTTRCARCGVLFASYT